MIIYLNGPPGSGKDTIADILVGEGFEHRKFTAPIRRMFCALHELSDAEIEPLKADLHTRQALIELGEGVRRVYGQGFFGRYAAQSLPTVGNVVFSDAGFTTEVEAVINSSPFAKHVLWRIHRKGRTFDGDSRNYVSGCSLGIRSLPLYNDATKDDLRTAVLRLLGESCL